MSGLPRDVDLTFEVDIPGELHEDLVEWVAVVTRDAVKQTLVEHNIGLVHSTTQFAEYDDPADGLADLVSLAAAGSFEDLLVNHYGED